MTIDWAESHQSSGKSSDSKGQRHSGSYKSKSDASRKELNGKAADGGYAKCRAAGVRLLAGREYSVLELTNKLSRRFSSEVVAEVVAELVSQRILDDRRYGEAFCRSRIDRGYGPGYITRELQQNGLDVELVDTLLEPYEDQWFARALTQAKKAYRPKTRRALHELGRLDEAAPAVDDESLDTVRGSGGDEELREEWRGEWKEQQKIRGRLARLLSRRGFPGGLTSTVIEQVLREAQAELKAELNPDSR